MKKTLVFGASLKSHRYSNFAIARLVAAGIDTYAFGPSAGVVHGVEVETDVPQIQDLDTVTLYMGPKRQAAYYQDIIHLKPRRVIFNPGTENAEFYQILKKKGIAAEEACTLTLLATRQY